MKKIKQKASVASDSVSIESDYLSRKNRNDFPHEKLVAEKVKSFKAYSNHHTAKELYDRIEKAHRDLYPHENNAGTEFTGQAVSMVSSVNMQLFQLMGQTQTNLSVLRQEYAATLGQIRTEWQALISKHNGPTSNAEEKINKLLTELLYYKKHDKHDEKEKVQKKYDQASQEFIQLVDEFVSVLDKGYSEWLIKFRDAQIAFYQKSAEEVARSWTSLS